MNWCVPVNPKDNMLGMIWQIAHMDGTALLTWQQAVTWVATWAVTWAVTWLTWQACSSAAASCVSRGVTATPATAKPFGGCCPFAKLPRLPTAQKHLLGTRSYKLP